MLLDVWPSNLYSAWHRDDGKYDARQAMSEATTVKLSLTGARPVSFSRNPTEITSNVDTISVAAQLGWQMRETCVRRSRV